MVREVDPPRQICSSTQLKHCPFVETLQNAPGSKTWWGGESSADPPKPVMTREFCKIDEDAFHLNANVIHLLRRVVSGTLLIVWSVVCFAGFRWSARTNPRCALKAAAAERFWIRCCYIVHHNCRVVFSQCKRGNVII